MARTARRKVEADVSLPAARKRAILRERAGLLAGRVQQQDRVTPDRVMLCAVGPNLYGIPLREVVRVVRFQGAGAAPTREPAMQGLVAGAGSIRAILDLGVLLGHSPSPAAGGWLVLLAAPFNAALRVESLPTAVDIASLDGEDSARVLEGEHEGKVLVRVSPAHLLNNLSTLRSGAAVP